MRIGLNAQKLSFAQAYHSGGISRYIYNLLVELRKLPSSHSIAAFAPQPSDDPDLADTSSFRLIPTGEPTERPVGRIIWEQASLPVLARARFDLLHGLAFSLPLAWRGRAVVTVLDLSFLRFPQMFNRGNRLYLGLIARLSARKANRVITISRHGRDEVASLLGVPKDRIITTYCAVDPRFRPLPAHEVRAFRASMQLPDRFILYLGTLEPRKNVVTLVRAYHRLRSRDHTTPPLVLAGAPGWLYEDVYAEIQKLSLEDSVRLTGFVPGNDLTHWYNAATVFAYPSIYEGFGLPPLEAMACGTPVVVSNASSLPEVVGQDGLLVDPFDVEGLAESLGRLLEDQHLHDRLSAAGQVRATRFSWAQMARETMLCYEQVLAAP